MVPIQRHIMKGREYRMPIPELLHLLIYLFKIHRAYRFYNILYNLYILLFFKNFIFHIKI
jgi:hypothetical protein